VAVNSLRKAPPTAWTVLTQTAADATNLEYIPFTGGEYLVAWNNGVSQRTLTLTGVSPQADIVSTIEADEFKAVRLTATGPFSQSGVAWFQASHSDVKFMVIRPTG